MGVDILGWVEVYKPFGSFDVWRGVISVGDVADRSYRMFGSLFGVRGDDEFTPIAAGRGLPTDLSQNAFTDARSGAVAPSWVLWSEIKAVDWEEEAQQAVDQRISEGPPLKRKDGLTLGWNVLFDLMRVLANHYGDERVRLVVWFDSL